MDFSRYSKHLQILLSVLLIVIIVSNANSISQAVESLKKVEKAKEDLENVQKETAQLSDSIEYAKTEEFLEKEALERYKLVKEPSTVLVIESAKTIEEQKAENEAKKEVAVEDPPIVKWKAFFKL